MRLFQNLFILTFLFSYQIIYAQWQPFAENILADSQRVASISILRICSVINIIIARSSLTFVSIILVAQVSASLV